MDAHRPSAVVGAGTLGRRIALMLARGGDDVRITDPDPAQRADAAAYLREHGADVTTTSDLAAAVSAAWLVVEAAPERLEVKRPLFAELSALAPPDAVLATNSSSYPSSALVDVVERPERLLNLHFYMPPERNAVEVMSCGRTDPAVVQRLMAVLPDYGLIPFEVRRESTGFIYNRIWAAIKREALAVVEEGVATPEEVDRLFCLNLGASSGPFARMDAVGLDVVLDIEEHYAAERPGIPEEPRRLLRRLVAERRLGRKTGRGFYDYGQE
ncbi:MAG TPA: 3-hydroxyacyl-CoA dehydrogenase family protein [Mycobacteriales bacterium]|nr:3-hydroxyacyl-CoA dehydrogenase family protein [Mycobacteriales bacterium]